jgi:acetyl-CoA/propionyl-CoA carboxylase carboxyl transferase subunit
MTVVRDEAPRKATTSPNRRTVTASPAARLVALLDDDGLQLLPAPDACGMLAATGTVEGTPVIAFATDPSVQGGAMSGEGCAVLVAAYDRALELGCPIVGIWHSGGARLQEGVSSLDGVGRVFAAMTRASGRIPQISLVLGPAAGGAAYGPALTDVVVLGPAGRVFVTGPDVVRSVTGEDVDMFRLGGPDPHGRRSGLVHVVGKTEGDAFDAVRRITALVGRTGELDVAAVDDIELGSMLPDDPKRAYDVHPLVNQILDPGTGVELHAKWAPNLVTTLGRFGGRTVGVVANNPLRLAGCLDAASGEKAARFVRMCDAFGIPLVVVVDVPGYLPGVGQEWEGVVRRGAKLLHAFAEATVPRVTLVTRKAIGGAYIAMNSSSLGATAVYAWPTAEVAVMGATAAVRILHRRRLAEVPEQRRLELEAELAAEHELLSGGVNRAVEIGVVDAVIDPAQTRSAIARAIAAAPDGRGRHGNIPL